MVAFVLRRGVGTVALISCRCAQPLLLDPEPTGLVVRHMAVTTEAGIAQVAHTLKVRSSARASRAREPYPTLLVDDVDEAFIASKPDQCRSQYALLHFLAKAKRRELGTPPEMPVYDLGGGKPDAEALSPVAVPPKAPVVPACNVALKGRLVVFRGPRTGLSALELFPHPHGHWDACLRINVFGSGPAAVPSR